MINEKKEIELIAALRKNARASLAKISNDLQMPKSTIFDKLKRHEKKLIRKHTSIIDFRKLGFNSRIFLSLKTMKEKRDVLQNYLEANKNINNLYIINGGFDFALEAVFKDAKETEDFIQEIKSKFPILELQKNTIITDVKRESFLEKT